MSQTLHISIELLDAAFHGRGDGGDPEWPPSPLRVLQAIVAAASWQSRGDLGPLAAEQSLRWLQCLPAPHIIAPLCRTGSQFRLYVPDNVADKVAASWMRGNEASIADYRTEKDVRPTWLLDGQRVHYLWAIPEIASAESARLVAPLQSAVRLITHLGWGIDMVAADARLISDGEAIRLSGERWMPADGVGAVRLRVPIAGTLDDLRTRHQRFLVRIGRDNRGDECLNPVPPLTAFRVVNYRRAGDPAPRPCRILHLINPDEGQPGQRPFSYPQDKLIHIAGMVRHLAVAAMRVDSPRDAPKDWVETYVAGHSQPGRTDHRQFSYVPLPSIGHTHTDPSIRRVMIVSPPGDEHRLEFLERRLVDRELQPEEGTYMPNRPVIDHMRNRAVVRQYIGESSTWASVTPVILPGHDDHNPAKTEKLILKALAQSGVNMPCEFEWRSVSWFPKSLSAHKYDRQKRPTGYIRPNHLLNYSAVHMRIKFSNDRRYSGPLIIGAGRHCGFGLFAIHE